MELVLEATSDLTSASVECHLYVCSCGDPQTDLLSDPTGTEAYGTKGGG